MTQTLLRFGLTVLALSACGSDGGTGPGRDEGTLTVSYGGFLDVPGGTFTARGEVGPGLAPGNWAFAEAGAGSSPMLLGASRSAPDGSGRYDTFLVELSLDPKTGDRFGFGSECGGEPPALPCAYLDLDFGREQRHLSIFNCFLQSGVLRVTERTRDRIKGTVSGSGFCGRTGGPLGSDAVPITGGSFDLPILDLA